MIGNRSMLSKSLQEAIAHAEETTKHNLGTQLNFAINYGGQYDILQACKQIVNKTKEDLLQLDQINESIFQKELETNCIGEFSNPDLLIRTSGELRISNFFLWQLAYSELYFVQRLFPDFEERDLIEALRSFQNRRSYNGNMH